MNPNIQLLGFGSVDFNTLRSSVDFVQRSVRVYGKEYPQPRLTRWYGPVPYLYSGLRWESSPLPSLLETIRERVETVTGERFNSVLCNLYRGGQDCVSWHADDEPLFGGDPIVASLSFGASRLFKVRHKQDHSQKMDYVLHDGSLLVMGRGVQPSWQHALPRTKAILGERINLTFRQVEPSAAQPL